MGLFLFGKDRTFSVENGLEGHVMPFNQLQIFKTLFAIKKSVHIESRRTGCENQLLV